MPRDASLSESQCRFFQADANNKKIMTLDFQFYLSRRKNTPYSRYVYIRKSCYCIYNIYIKYSRIKHTVDNLVIMWTLIVNKLTIINYYIIITSKVWRNLKIPSQEANKWFILYFRYLFPFFIIYSMETLFIYWVVTEKLSSHKSCQITWVFIFSL